MEQTPTFGVKCATISSAIFAPRLSVESETSNTFTVPYWWHRLFARYRLRRTRHDRRGRRESCNFTSRRGSCRNGRNAATDPIASLSTSRSSPHAISVDQPRAEDLDAKPELPPDRTASSYLPDKQEQPSVASEQQPSAEANATPSPQGAEPADGASRSEGSEFVKVTSMTEVRNGPDDSSQVIGTARRGAVAEVLARSPDGYVSATPLHLTPVGLAPTL